MFDAWKRIIGEEGITALWTGCGPTIGRAMVVNVCQLCCQTQAKEEIAKRTSGKFYVQSRRLKTWKWTVSSKLDGQSVGQINPLFERTVEFIRWSSIFDGFYPSVQVSWTVHFASWPSNLTLFLVKEGYFLSFLGSMVAGFITTCASLPVDIAKTRTQNMKVIHKYDS